MRPRPAGTTRTWLALAASAALLSACASAAPTAVPGGTASAAPPGGAPKSTVAASPLARSTPVRLRIPAIGVDTPVIQVGLNSDGTVDVPPIAAHAPAAWYDGSPTPGQTGPSVILGHVTVGRFGDGVFLRLEQLKAGDRIEVAPRDGATAAFTVDSVQTVAKAQFPTNAVYGNVDRPALRLITCGGARQSAGGYPDNVIVYATLR
jgi:LPXTG-site transpeptidase (sortase) family protein